VRHSAAVEISSIVYRTKEEAVLTKSLGVSDMRHTTRNSPETSVVVDPTPGLTDRERATTRLGVMRVTAEQQLMSEEKKKRGRRRGRLQKEGKRSKTAQVIGFRQVTGGNGGKTRREIITS